MWLVLAAKTARKAGGRWLPAAQPLVKSLFADAARETGGRFGPVGFARPFHGR
jgi:hypothetical protein